MNEKNYDLKNKDEPTASTHSDHILLCSIFIIDLVFTFVQYFKLTKLNMPYFLHPLPSHLIVPWARLFLGKIYELWCER